MDDFDAVKVSAYFAERLSLFVGQQDEDEAIRRAVEEFIEEATDDEGDREGGPT